MSEHSVVFGGLFESGEVKRVAIFTHRNPDPDAMASASGLAWLMNKKYGVESRIFYEGEISHKQNQTMVNVFELVLERFSEYNPDESDLTIIVDSTQKTVPVNADVVIDHHRVPDALGTKLTVVEPIGASATLVWELIRDLGVEFDDDVDGRVATALFFGIRKDTDELVGEAVTDRDFDAYKSLADHVDRRKLTQVVNYPLPKYIFDLRKKLTEDGNSVQEDSYFVGTVGVISSTKRDALPMLADEMVRLEGVETTVIFAIVGKSIEASIRSSNQSLDVNRFSKAVFGDGFAGGRMGSGGARVPLGVFEYDGLPGDVCDALWESQKQVLFHRILQIALGR